MTTMQFFYADLVNDHSLLVTIALRRWRDAAAAAGMLSCWLLAAGIWRANVLGICLGGVANG